MDGWQSPVKPWLRCNNHQMAQHHFCCLPGEPDPRYRAHVQRNVLGDRR